MILEGADVAVCEGTASVAGGPRASLLVVPSSDLVNNQVHNFSH